ncbi:MAG: hypothetical protein M3300_05525 [Actinomycetota bacterium]|nr:hypothetical protein [Actinomycetota bacterium]
MICGDPGEDAAAHNARPTPRRPVTGAARLAEAAGEVPDRQLWALGWTTKDPE